MPQKHATSTTLGWRAVWTPFVTCPSRTWRTWVCLWWECPHHFPCTPGKSYFQCVGPCFLWDNVTHSKMPRSERWKEACPISLLNLEEGVSREPTDHRKWVRVLEKLLVQSIWAWNHYFNVLCAPVSIHSIITHCLMFSKKNRSFCIFTQCPFKTVFKRIYK